MQAVELIVEGLPLELDLGQPFLHLRFRLHPQNYKYCAALSRRVGHGRELVNRGRLQFLGNIVYGIDLNHNNLNSKWLMLESSQEERRSNGRWSKVEHEKFLLGLQLYGKDWKRIEALVATRTGAQIRSHAQKFFIRNRKDPQGDTAEEQDPQTPSSMPPPAQQEDHSYFLAKIVGLYSQEEDFDFWESLVDHKVQNNEERPARKGSFITVASDCGEHERPPCKRLKSDSLPGSIGCGEFF